MPIPKSLNWEECTRNGGPSDSMAANPSFLFGRQDWSTFRTAGCVLWAVFNCSCDGVVEEATKLTLANNCMAVVPASEPDIPSERELCCVWIENVQSTCACQLVSYAPPTPCDASLDQPGNRCVFLLFVHSRLLTVHGTVATGGRYVVLIFRILDSPTGKTLLNQDAFLFFIAGDCRSIRLHTC